MIFVVWWVFDDKRRGKDRKVTCSFEPLRRRSGRLDRNARVHANLQTWVRNAVDAIIKACQKEKGGKGETKIKSPPS